MASAKLWTTEVSLDIESSMLVSRDSTEDDDGDIDFVNGILESPVFLKRYTREHFDRQEPLW